MLHPDIADVLAGRRRWALVEGDCLEVLPTLPGGAVDAVVTDPPYGIGYPYLGYEDTPDNLRRLIAGAVPECRRIGRRVLLFCGVQNVSLYPPSDWVLCYSWATTGSFGAMGYNQWQPVLLYGKDVPGTGSVNGVLKSDVMRFTGGDGVGFMRRMGKGEHPCPKPENVIRRLVRRVTTEADLVLDPFAGSGTTGVACLQTGRRFIGIEISPEYAAIARKRLEAAERDQRDSLFPAAGFEPEPVVQPFLFADDG